MRGAARRGAVGWRSLPRPAVLGNRAPSRAGSLLPITLLILSVSVALTFTSVELAFHAIRRSRQLLWSDRLTRAADEGLQKTWRSWDTIPPWTAPVGTPGARVVVSGAGDTVHVTWRRTHPLIVWTHARASTTLGGTRLERSVQRVAWLQAPIPARAEEMLQGAFGPPPPVTPWAAIASEPSRDWRFLRLPAPSSSAPRRLRHRGWVIVDGGVHLADGSQVEGVLVVRGPLHVTGQVTVQGELLVLEGTVPSGLVVHRDHFATEMALATAAHPRLAPFHLWYEPP